MSKKSKMTDRWYFVPGFGVFSRRFLPDPAAEWKTNSFYINLRGSGADLSQTGFGFMKEAAHVVKETSPNFTNDANLCLNVFRTDDLNWLHSLQCSLFPPQRQAMHVDLPTPSKPTAINWFAETWNTNLTQHTVNKNAANGRTSCRRRGVVLDHGPDRLKSVGGGHGLTGKREVVDVMGRALTDKISNLKTMENQLLYDDNISISSMRLFLQEVEVRISKRNVQVNLFLQSDKSSLQSLENQPTSQKYLGDNAKKLQTCYWHVPHMFTPAVPKLFGCWAKFATLSVSAGRTALCIEKKQENPHT